MDTHTKPTMDQLMQWTSALQWSRIVIQHKIAELDRWAIGHEYDDLSLKRLDDLEAFLNGVVKERLNDTFHGTVKEVAASV
jgi:hypothetical protein